MRQQETENTRIVYKRDLFEISQMLRMGYNQTFTKFFFDVSLSVSCGITSF